MQENNGLKSILNQTEIASINSIADIENIKIDKEKFNKLNTKKEQATNEYIYLI